jgi:predicted CXXCH cytochrome family protein
LTRKRRRGSANKRSGATAGTNSAPSTPLPRQGEPVPLNAEPRVASRRLVWVGAILSTLIVLVGGFAFQYFPAHSRTIQASNTAPGFVGSQTCSGCHAAEANLWRSSHHKQAMAHATKQSVLGDFNDSSFDYGGVHSRFFSKAGKFFVETDGPNGKLSTFEVSYTFGIDPLQQYLIAFPDGRLQALSIAWDSRPKARGGQRWFHLYPNDTIRHDDILHWTKLNQNWNHMCAECHSTGVRKNYDATADHFATTWAEINVGCESCHGAGSRHVAWARSLHSWWSFGNTDDPDKGLAVRFDARSTVTWTHNPTTGAPERSRQPDLLRKEVETCGLCHARRAPLSADWVPGHWLADTHQITPMSRGLFHADGQMRDVEESYNYAAFKQSKMFAMGVTCSDCHDPHSAALRVQGDGLCLQCHTASKYKPAVHSHHADVIPSVSCVSCHMPTRTYMVIDPRHDHSFRVPRPDVSAKLDTPNACNDCHRDKSAQWAAAAIESWFGPHREGFQTYASAFHAAWMDQRDASRLLADVASDVSNPGFIRASAFAALAGHLPQINVALTRRGLSDPDPMVRIGALDELEGAPVSQLWPLAAPFLADPILGVRIRAVSLLASMPTENQPPADRENFARAAAEFVAAQRLNADRPEARSALGNFYAEQGLSTEAKAEFEAALHLSPQFAPAAINLADLYRQLGQDDAGVDVLRIAIIASPKDAGLHYALGLALVRLKRNDEAVAELLRSTQIDPDQTRYVYVYAIALHAGKRTQEAIAVLKANLARHPDDLNTLAALVGLHREIGDMETALDYTRRLTEAEANSDLLIPKPAR